MADQECRLNHPHLRPVRGTLVPRLLLPFSGIPCRLYKNLHDNLGNLDKVLHEVCQLGQLCHVIFCFALSALFALSRSKVQIVQIVQCHFFASVWLINRYLFLGILSNPLTIPVVLPRGCRGKVSTGILQKTQILAITYANKASAMDSRAGI